MELAGTAAMITGGASGLGAATAEALVKAGARVALIDRNEAAVQAAATRLGAPNGVLGIACDVTDDSSAQSAFATARATHGPVRILVNCAGIADAGRIVGRDGPLALAAFTKVIHVNLIGTFNMLRLAAAEMSALDPGADGERGVIINTASVAAFEGQVGQAAYAASKAGVAGLTIQAARELSRAGIRVMTIAPGLINTPMFDGLPDEVKTSLASSVPFPQRLGVPGDYAALALHIMTNRYLNGETIRLDGALRMAPR